MNKILNIIGAAIIAFLAALIPLTYSRGKQAEKERLERKELEGQNVFYKRMAEETTKINRPSSLPLPDKLRHHGL